MIMSYKSISSNTINRQQTGGIIMTELSEILPLLPFWRRSEQK